MLLILFSSHIHAEEVLGYQIQKVINDKVIVVLNYKLLVDKHFQCSRWKQGDRVAPLGDNFTGHGIQQMYNYTKNESCWFIYVK